MLWVKAFHIVFVVTWFAGLFYLPRLFVYHAMTTDQAGAERFKVMERKLYYGIMTPGAILTAIFGVWLWVAAVNSGNGFSGRWLEVKLALVLGLIGFHVYCANLLRDFRYDRNRHGHMFYRWLNEIPVIFLIAIVILAVVKPI